MEWIDQWAYNENIRINYLESRTHDERLMPLLYIPGALDAAEQALDMLNGFYPRKRMAVSLRGRGKARIRKAVIHWGGCQSERIGEILPDGAFIGGAVCHSVCCKPSRRQGTDYR